MNTKIVTGLLAFAILIGTALFVSAKVGTCDWPNTCSGITNPCPAGVIC